MSFICGPGDNLSASYSSGHIVLPMAGYPGIMFPLPRPRPLPCAAKAA